MSKETNLSDHKIFYKNMQNFLGPESLRPECSTSHNRSGLKKWENLGPESFGPDWLAFQNPQKAKQWRRRGGGQVG